MKLNYGTEWIDPPLFIKAGCYLMAGLDDQDYWWVPSILKTQNIS